PRRSGTCASSGSQGRPLPPGPARGTLELAQLALQILEHPSAAVPERRIVDADVAAKIDPVQVTPGHLAEGAVEERRAPELGAVDAEHVGERSRPARDVPRSQPVVEALEQEPAGAVDRQHPEI